MATKKKNSRQKGQRGERALVKKFEAWWDEEFFRTPASGGLATMGFQFKGIEISGDVSTPDPSFPFCVEGKNCEGWSLEKLLTAPKNDIYRWWKQTVLETPEGKIPLLVFKRNRHPWLFMIFVDDYLATIPSTALVLQREGCDNVLIGLGTDLWESKKEIWINAKPAKRKYKVRSSEDEFESLPGL